MATQINTNQIKDGAVTAAKLSFVPTQVLAMVDTFSKLVDNDGSETAIMTETIPGGTLGSTGLIVGRIRGWARNESGSNKTVVLRLKYGAETLATTGAIDIPNGITESAVHVDFVLAANAGESAQLGGLTAGIFLLDEQKTEGGADDGSASQDSSGDLDLVVTWDFSAADGALEYKQYGYELQFADPG